MEHKGMNIFLHKRKIDDVVHNVLCRMRTVPAFVAFCEQVLFKWKNI